MNIQTWRSGLRSWLTAKMLVNTWDLRNPLVYSTINGFIPPLQSLVYVNDSVGSVVALQDFYLTSRYPATIKYADLPLGQLEQTYVTIARRLSLEYLSLAALTDFDMLPVPDSIQVIEYGDGLADWLVTLVFSCRLTWIVSPTLLPGDVITPLPTINKLVTGLFTEALTSTDHLNPLTRDKFGTLVVKR